jgi:hypothetical protein
VLKQIKGTRKEEKMKLSKVVVFFYQQTHAKTSLNQQQVRGLTTHEIVMAKPFTVPFMSSA